MISQLANLNWVSVLAAFVPYFILGGLWFIVLFSKPYKFSLGKAGQELPQKPIFIVGTALCCLVITLATAVLFRTLGISSFGAAVELSLVIGVGFLVANTVNIAINPNIPRPLLYSVVSGAYHLVGIVLVGIILTALN